MPAINKNHQPQCRNRFQKMMSSCRLRRGSSAKILCMTEDDDGDSTSSTMSTMPVLLSPKSSSHQLASTTSTAAPPTTAPKRQKVCFQEHANKYYRNTAVCREECQELWYTMTEYAQLKNAAKFVASEINKREQRRASSSSSSDSSPSTEPRFLSYQAIMQRTFAACRTCPLINDSVDDDFSVLTRAEQENLQRWMGVATMRLGLERTTIKEIGKDRYHRRKHIIKAVLTAQEEMRAVTRKEQEQQGQGIVQSSSYTSLTEEHTSSLRSVSTAVSQPSRLFAREIARAQAVIV